MKWKQWVKARFVCIKIKQNKNEIKNKTRKKRERSETTHEIFYLLFTGDVVLLMVRLQWKVMEARNEPINKNTPQKTHRKENEWMIEKGKSKVNETNHASLTLHCVCFFHLGFYRTT